MNPERDQPGVPRPLELRAEPWLEIIFEPPPGQSEELASELVELGASGAWIDEDNLVHAFVREPGVVQLEAGRKVVRRNRVPDRNWVKECKELWQEVQVGNLRIAPPTPIPPGSETIFILPGAGFGTGHHASTKLALRLMQDLQGTCPGKDSILDLGTGSGILALAAEKLFTGRVLAVDNDRDALENAAENLQLNYSRRITLQLSGGTVPEGRFGLVCANLYSELLKNLSTQVCAAARPDGHLILSGIMVDQAPGVLDAYNRSGARCLLRLEEAEWVGLLMLL